MKDSGIPWIGEIGQGFDIYRLKYLLSEPLAYGANEAGIPFEETLPRYIRITDISMDGKLKDDGKLSLSIDAAKDYLLKENDILLARSGASVGKAFVFKESYGESAFAGYLIRARLKEDFNAQYLFYYTQSALYEEWKKQTFVQSTIQNIGADKYNQLPVVLPCKKVQDEIVFALDTECARIDAVMEQTRASIEEYKKLKQSVITQAVTKGIRPNRPMKDSGIDWIGQIPAEWEVYRIANLYDERNESGQVDLPILSVSINTGISDHEVADEEQTRVFVRSEDKTKYKRVYPGDLAYNMMRAWQGAFGAVRVDGMVSPAYVVAKPKQGIKLDSRFMEALLRTPAAIEEMHRYSRGITDFRLRLYWPEFKNIRVCIPSETEQNEIADFIDEKSIEFDALIAKKEHFLSEMESYKKSLFFEYVTGKKEVS